MVKIAKCFREFFFAHIQTGPRLNVASNLICSDEFLCLVWILFFMFLLLNGTIYFFFMEYVRELRIKLTVSTACQRIRYSERAWTVSVHEISWIHLLSVRAAATVLICSESLVWWACKSQLRSGKVSFGRAENLTRTRSGCRRPARCQWKHWTSLGHCTVSLPKSMSKFFHGLLASVRLSQRMRYSERT